MHYITRVYVTKPFKVIAYGIRQLRHAAQRKQLQHDLSVKYVQYKIDAKVRAYKEATARERLAICTKDTYRTCKGAVKLTGKVVAFIAFNPIAANLIRSYAAWHVITNPIVIRRAIMLILPTATANAVIVLCSYGSIYVMAANVRHIKHYIDHHWHIHNEDNDMVCAYDAL